MTTVTLAAGGAGAMGVDLLVILACAGVIALLLGRLRVAVIPGYLIAGAIVGPHGVGLVADSDRLDDIAKIATVLLMFSIGMHLDMSSLRRGAVWIVLTGVVSTLATGAAIALGALPFGVPARGAVAIGMALSMSSTAVVMRLLQSRRELYTAHGRTCLGVLLVQDLLVVAMLAAIPMLAGMGAGAAHGAGEAVAAGGAITSVGGALVALAGVAVLIAAGKLGLPRLMRVVASGRQDELMLVVTAAAALGAAVLTGAVGLSPELGSFIAGFLLSATPFRHHLSGQITPLRDLFMAVFFTVVGMSVALEFIAPVFWAVIIGVVVVIVLKSALIGVAAWMCGAATPVAVRSGLALGQGGEFSLLVLSVAFAAGLITEQTQAVVIAVVVVTLILTPAMVGAGEGLAKKLAGAPPAPWFRVPPIREHPSIVEAEGHARTRAIIAGYGPIGRACASRMEALGVTYVVVEMNARTVWSEASRGVPMMYGDVTNAEVLENAGIEHADAVVLTMPDRDAMLRAIRVVRRVRRDIRIGVRVTLEQAGEEARAAGADDVIVEESATAEALARALERALRKPESA